MRLELEIPESRILLSDFEAWHAVLNDWYLSSSEAEAEAFHRGQDLLSEDSRRAKIEESWKRIFDLEGGNPDWRGEPEERSIQATLWYLEAQEVVGIKRFEGVKKKKRKKRARNDS